MANLKAGTLIGGNLIWSAGNLPLRVADSNIFINDTQIYTEKYKPTPAAIGAVNKAGDTMTGILIGTTFKSGSGRALVSTTNEQHGVYIGNNTDYRTILGGGHATSGTVVMRPKGIGDANFNTVFNNDGTITASAAPTSGAHLTRKDYVDSQVSTKLSLSGGTMTGKLILGYPSAVKVPVGTTAQRGSGVAGDFRFNSDEKGYEGFDGSEWQPIGSGRIAYTRFTSNFTAVKGKGHLVDTTKAGIVATLPSGMNEADFVVIGDGSGQASKNPFYIAGYNGDRIVVNADNCMLLFSWVSGKWVITNGIGETGAIDTANYVKKAGDVMTGRLRFPMLQNMSTSDLNNIDDSGVSFNFSPQEAAGKPTGIDHAVFTQAFSDLWQTQLASDWRTNKWYVRTQENGVWKGWAEVYTTLTKPTAADVGAMPVTGAVDFNWNGHGSTMPGHYYHNTYSDNDRTVYVHAYKGSHGAYNSYYHLRTSNVNGNYDVHVFGKDGLSVNGHSYYHQGFKPTAADVGALPITGGTVNGGITVRDGMTITGIGNVIETIGGYIRSNREDVMSLDGKHFSFVTAPNDAHLCGNAYSDGRMWLKYDNSKPSAYAVCGVNGEFNVFTSVAGNSNPQQTKALNLSNNGNLTVANVINAKNAVFVSSPTGNHSIAMESYDNHNPYIAYKADGMSGPRIALTFNDYIINAEARITANEVLVKAEGGLRFSVDDTLPGESWGAGLNPNTGHFGIHHYTGGVWKKMPLQIRHYDGVVSCLHGLETPTVNLTGTGNVLSTIGGYIHSTSESFMMLYGKTHSFVASPNDAHLCRNSYWDGAVWRKYDNNDASAYVACAAGGQLNVYTSVAGSSNPQQLKVLNVSNDGNLTVANSLTTHGHTLQLAGDHQNLHLWFKNGAGSERALIYHEGSTNTLNLRVGGTSTAFRVNPNGAAEVMNLHNGHTAFYTASQVIGDSAAVVRGLVQPGAWVDVYARSSGLQVDIVDSASSATNIWKATHWGVNHVAAMDVHRPPIGTVVRILAYNTAFSFNENGQGLAPGGWHTGSDERFKENIRPLSVQKTSWLDKVCSLNASSFKYKTNDKQSIGFIAQNVQKIIPEAVTAQVDTTKPESERAETERLYLDPMAIIAAQNEAIKELVARIEALERK